MRTRAARGALFAGAACCLVGLKKERNLMTNRRRILKKLPLLLVALHLGWALVLCLCVTPLPAFAQDEHATSKPGASGEFLIGNVFSVGNGPVSVADGDFNKDGKPDLVVANASDNTIGLLLGTGKGTFGAQKTFHATNPGYVGVADFNGDGNLDVLTVAYNFNSIGILLGNGKGGFAPEVGMLFEGTSGCYSAAIGDFNRDGKADIAVACTGGDVILLGNGKGTFATPVILTAGDSFLAVADVNGDGFEDLVGADGAGPYVDVSLGNGDGTFQPPERFYTGEPPKTLAIADFNGDGRPDIAVAIATSYNLLGILLGNGDGTFGSLTTVVSGGLGIGLDFALAADLDGDKKQDLVVVTADGDPYNGTTMLLYGNGDGTFQAPEYYATGRVSVAGLIADLNGDGLLDLAVVAEDGQGSQNAGAGTVTVLLGQGNRVFQGPSSYLMGGTEIPVVEAFNLRNLDGKLDLIALDVEAHAAAVLLGNGDGTFQPASFWYFPQTSGISGPGLAIADFCGFGHLDLVAAAVSSTCYNCPIVSILCGYGDGTFDTTAKVTGIPFAADAMVAGDFNRDGKQDLVVGSEGGVAILLGNGDGSFQPPPADLDYDALYLLAADFNGDHKLDIAAIGQTGIEILLGNGDGTFQPGIATSTAGNITGVVEADFNHDKKPDIAISVGSGVYVFLGNGDGTFQSPLFSAAGNTPTGLAAGDVNGDGVPDLVAQDSSYDTLNVLIGNGDGTFRPPVLYDAGAGEDYYPPIPALGDFNGDGALDMAAPYTALHDASASVEVVLNTGGTAVGLTSSANPSGAGKPVTFTAKVTESVLVLNSPVPAGSVIFKDGSTTLASVPLSSGSAAFTTSALAPGSHKITATYAGNSHYNRHVSAALTQTVQ
jgi:hypothetical protein